MRRTDIENVRKKALTDAAIQAVGAQGSMDVTMADIAARAGVSPALAHHYFGSKQDLMLAAARRTQVRYRHRTQADADPARTCLRNHPGFLFQQAVFRPRRCSLACLLCGGSAQCGSFPAARHLWPAPPLEPDERTAADGG